MNRKQKLEDLSWNNFNVENIEVLTRQLKDLVNALHADKRHAALATGHAIQARVESLVHQLDRYAARAVR